MMSHITEHIELMPITIFVLLFLFVVFLIWYVFSHNDREYYTDTIGSFMGSALSFLLGLQSFAGLAIPSHVQIQDEGLLYIYQSSFLGLFMVVLGVILLILAFIKIFVSASETTKNIGV